VGGPTTGCGSWRRATPDTAELQRSSSVVAAGLGAGGAVRCGGGDGGRPGAGFAFASFAFSSRSFSSSALFQGFFDTPPL
jgi:hypothetical protein